MFSNDAIPSQFLAHWSQGVPVVLKDVPISGCDPDYFIRRHGDMDVTIEDCEDPAQVRKVRAAAYFGSFGRLLDVANPHRIWKLKAIIPILFVLIHKLLTSFSGLAPEGKLQDRVLAAT